MLSRAKSDNDEMTMKLVQVFIFHKIAQVYVGYIMKIDVVSKSLNIRPTSVPTGCCDAETSEELSSTVPPWSRN